MTTLQQSEREWIMSIRGKTIEKVIARVEHNNDVYELLGFGYENYPEPQFFFIRINGVEMKQPNGQLLSSYWDDEVVYYVKDYFVQTLLFNATKEVESIW